MLDLRNTGAITCAQNEANSAIFGMPKEAIKLDAALFVGTPDEIRQRLDAILEVQQVVGVNMNYAKG